MRAGASPVGYDATALDEKEKRRHRPRGRSLPAHWDSDTNRAVPTVRTAPPAPQPGGSGSGSRSFALARWQVEKPPGEVFGFKSPYGLTHQTCRTPDRQGRTATGPRRRRPLRGRSSSCGRLLLEPQRARRRLGASRSGLARPARPESGPAPARARPGGSLASSPTGAAVAGETPGRARRWPRSTRRCDRLPARRTTDHRRRAATCPVRRRAGGRPPPPRRRRAGVPEREPVARLRGRAARRARRSALPLALRPSPQPGPAQPPLPRPRARAPGRRLAHRLDGGGQSPGRAECPLRESATQGTPGQAWDPRAILCRSSASSSVASSTPFSMATSRMVRREATASVTISVARS